MGYTIHAVLSPARRAWLEQLDREGLAKRRPRGRVGYDCWKLEWTQGVYGGRDKQWFGEALTNEGRRVLEEARFSDRGRAA